MQQHHRQLRFFVRRSAFTLVEMLVVCAIILILALLTISMIHFVSQNAKIAKTRATILKLDTAMQQIFADYEYKFISIQNEVRRKVEEGEAGYDNISEEEQQRRTAHFIRDLMRMEMPQSWAEVYNLDYNEELLPLAVDGEHYIDPSPLFIFYQEEYQRWVAADTANRLRQSPSRAALFFLIIQNLNPESLNAFHSNEVRRNEHDMFEFIDAWGRPIQFLRWAPALTDSDLQYNVLKDAGYTPVVGRNNNNREWWIGRYMSRNTELLEPMRQATQNHPDHMDERVIAVLLENQLRIQRGEPEETLDFIGWFLYPLIYSVGPDGIAGIDSGNDREQTAIFGGILDPFLVPFGMPDGTGRHLDNVHNHQWYR